MDLINNFLINIVSSWKTWWSVKEFRVQLIVTILAFAAVLHYSCLFISIWEARIGMVIHDPVLNMLSPKNFSVPIFFIVHSSIIITFILLLDEPNVLVKAFQAYSLALFLRTVSIYFVPLEAPHGMIFLEDPITASFLNSINVVTKDLFFSGHISAMFVFIYFSTHKFWKSYLMCITPILAVLILWQHVHYTLDIIAAPFFTYICCKLVEKLNEKWTYGIDQLQQQIINISK